MNVITKFALYLILIAGYAELSGQSWQKESSGIVFSAKQSESSVKNKLMN